MKKIVILGKEFEYKLIAEASEYSDGVYTEFYDGVRMVKRKKYFLWGRVITKLELNDVFRVYYNIEDPSRTKEQIRKRLEHEVELLGRAEEIKRGEII